MASLTEPGRVVMKIAGREAGKLAVIVEKKDDNFVTIDGQCKRRRCNLSHLELTPLTVDIKKGASHEEIIAALKKHSIEVQTKPQKEHKETAVKPVKAPAAKEEQKAKPAAKKKVK